MTANPVEVERLVGELMKGLRESGQFSPGDALSAVMTFTYRFATAIVTLSETPEARAVNMTTVAQSLRLMAARVEFDAGEAGKEKVH